MAFRTNRWSLGELLERTPQIPTLAAAARDAEIRRSTLTDVLSGRRDASEELLDRMSDVLACDRRAISADPFGIIPPLEAVAAAARQLAPHLNGHDFGLRAALAALDEVE